jgi:hypothetical protein
LSGTLYIPRGSKKVGCCLILLLECANGYKPRGSSKVGVFGEAKKANQKQNESKVFLRGIEEG